MGRVNKIKDLQKKILRLRSQKERSALNPPYDCTYCEGFNCVQVTVRELTYTFHCLDCDKREIVPQADWIELIDYYNLIADKWRAERLQKRYRKLPTFEIIVDRIKDRRGISELKHITYGSVQLFINKGGEVLPIPIKDALELPEEAPDRSVVDWSSVVAQIIASGEYYSAREVCELFANNEVKVFRTKSVLDKAVGQGLLARFWHQRKYIYGKIIE